MLYSFMASVPANRIVQRAWKLDEATKLQAVAEMERLTGIAPNGAHAIKQADGAPPSSVHFASRAARRHSIQHHELFKQRIHTIRSRSASMQKELLASLRSRSVCSQQKESHTLSNGITRSPIATDHSGCRHRAAARSPAVFNPIVYARAILKHSHVCMV